MIEHAAITASAITPDKSLEEFRVEFNKLIQDFEGVASGNTFTSTIIFEGATADSNETTFSIDEPTADRTVALPDKTGTIELLDGLILNSTDGSANAGDNIVQNTSANDGDRILLEDATSDVLLVLASHGITLSGVGWNTFQFDNDHS